MLNTSQTSFIQSEINQPAQSILHVVELLDEGATVPFIARYRKEKTGGMDEVQILYIKKSFEKFLVADKRREAMIASIEEQGKMTPELFNSLKNALHLSELEDLFLPYKQKRKTRASMAKEKGLEPLADLIFNQSVHNLEEMAEKYVNDDVANLDEALQGARDIIAERVNEDLKARHCVRKVFNKGAFVESEVKKGKEKEGEKYADYFDHSEPLKHIPSHRLLAIRRGESEGFLKVKITVDEEKAVDLLERLFVKGSPACQKQMQQAIADAYKRLLCPSVENEYAGLSKDRADEEAIAIFSKNLRQLLLSAPLGQKRVLAIDPGYRTGCKTVVLNEVGDLLYDTVIYLTNNGLEAESKVRKLVEKYRVQAVAIGNGTASRETEQFVKDLKLDIESGVFMVSEQGASIYSASSIARDEFPDKDITVRGAVSIGRRLKDPLAELVKIDAKSIGVGQYQHDVNQKTLKESLDSVVESCVNAVGVELNTASEHLLSYVSGLGPSLAKNIVLYRSEKGKFKSRKELMKVSRLGGKAYEQAAGFLRIHNAKNILDNTAVHPERYELVQRIAKEHGHEVQDLIAHESVRKGIDLKKYVSNDVGLPTLNDIMQELAKPGRDPREKLEAFEFGNVHKMEDLKEGMVLPGIVTNITAFGCFVDIGVHQDGLVHISHLANKFVKDPNEVVEVHQKVMVKVLEVNVDRKRISLSMKEV